MFTCATGKRGFSLVELMIVVTILGILGLVVGGMVGNSSDQAREAATLEALQRAQSAVQMYRTYTGRLPNLLSGWGDLTTKVVVNGKTFPPLLQAPPKNQLTTPALSTVIPGVAATLSLGDAGFQYDYRGGAGTGRLVAAGLPAINTGRLGTIPKGTEAVTVPSDPMNEGR